MTASLLYYKNALKNEKKREKKITQSFAKFILIRSTKMLKQTLYVTLYDVDQYFLNELRLRCLGCSLMARLK